MVVRNAERLTRAIGRSTWHWLALAFVTCACSAGAAASATTQVAQLPGEPMWKKASAGDRCPADTFEVNAGASGTGCAVCNVDLPENCRVRCDAGNGHACSLLGGMYFFGMHFQIDHARSIALYRRGCSLGSATSCQALAGQLARGEGCTRDEQAGLALLEPLCRQGRGLACVSLGEMYVARGTPGDAEAAARTFTRACELDVPQGCFRLAQTCSSTGDASPCAPPALARACELGEPRACVRPQHD